jgi:hypothetical protein
MIGKLRKYYAQSSFGRPEAFVLWNSALILYTTRMVAAVHPMIEEQGQVPFGVCIRPTSEQSRGRSCTHFRCGGKHRGLVALKLSRTSIRFRKFANATSQSAQWVNPGRCSTLPSGQNITKPTHKEGSGHVCASYNEMDRFYVQLVKRLSGMPGKIPIGLVCGYSG